MFRDSLWGWSFFLVDHRTLSDMYSIFLHLFLSSLSTAENSGRKECFSLKKFASHHPRFSIFVSINKQT